MRCDNVCDLAFIAYQLGPHDGADLQDAVEDLMRVTRALALSDLLVPYGITDTDYGFARRKVANALKGVRVTRKPKGSDNGEPAARAPKKGRKS